MTVLSRFGPTLGSSSSQLLRISPISLRSHTSHGGLSLGPDRQAFNPHNRVPRGIRHFSIGNSLETAAYEASQFITTIHTVTGTPWYITIPLAALMVNVAVRLPVSIYSRKLEQKRVKLHPLFWAWNSRHAQQLMRADPRRTPAELQPYIQKLAQATERRICKQHGVQTWKIYYLGSISAFPFFITAIQGVRKLCGAGGGLFGLFTNPLPIIRDSLTRKPEGTSAASSAAISTEHTADAAPWSTEFPQYDTLPTSTTPEAPQAALSSDLLGYEPSLSTGGCLWFPDLTVPDPTHILPVLLSAAMLWVVLPKTMAHTRTLLDPTAKDLSWRTRFHRALLVVSLVIGPVTMHLPAAMHLYWISSTLIATTQGDYVRKMWKLPRNDYKSAVGRDVPIVQPPPPPPSP